MSEAETIVCRPTRWFYLRAGAMVVMFGVFLVLFLKDWKFGWPKKNEAFFTYEAFEEAERMFAEHVAANKSAAEWEALAREQKIGFPDEKGMLPDGVDSDAPWPEELVDYAGYEKAHAEEGQKLIPPLWASYTDKRGWSSAKPKKSYEAGKIRDQLYWGIGSGVLLLITSALLVRTSRRSMKADDESYHAPNGMRIPFAAMRRIDKRKWDTKGLAYVFYQLDGSGEDDDLQKAKVDGMVYGQFSQEDGAPAEALFQRILENFKGELIELAEEEEDELEQEGVGEGKEGEKE